MNIFTAKQTQVYDALAHLYGENAVDFFCNTLGYDILENADIYNELVDMGELHEEEETNDMPYDTLAEDNDWD